MISVIKRTLILFVIPSMILGEAYVLYKKGDVSLTRSEKSIPVNKYTEVEPGDVIQTGEKSIAIISYGGGSKIKIDPNSKMELELDSVAVGVNNDLYTKVRVMTGSILVDHDKKKKNQKIEVDIKSVSLGVRGTKFFAGVDEVDNNLYMAVESGSVGTLNYAKDDHEVVNKSKAIVVDKGSRLTRPHTYEWQKNINFSFADSGSRIGSGFDYPIYALSRRKEYAFDRDELLKRRRKRIDAEHFKLRKILERGGVSIKKNSYSFNPSNYWKKVRVKNGETAVLFVNGKVEVKRGGERKKLARGDKLKAGDLISTGPESVLILGYPGKSQLKMDSNSRLNIVHISQKKKGEKFTSLKLLAGSVLVNHNQENVKEEIDIQVGSNSVETKKSEFFIGFDKLNSNNVYIHNLSGDVSVLNYVNNDFELLSPKDSIVVDNSMYLTMPSRADWSREIVYDFGSEDVVLESNFQLNETKSKINSNYKKKREKLFKRERKVIPESVMNAYKSRVNKVAQ